MKPQHFSILAIMVVLLILALVLVNKQAENITAQSLQIEIVK